MGGPVFSNRVCDWLMVASACARVWLGTRRGSDGGWRSGMRVMAAGAWLWAGLFRGGGALWSVWTRHYLRTRCFDNMAWWVTS